MNEHGSITQGLSPRRKAYDITMRTLLYVSAATICALLVFLIGYILYRGIPSPVSYTHLGRRFVFILSAALYALFAFARFLWRRRVPITIISTRMTAAAQILSLIHILKPGGKTGGPPSKPKYYLMTDRGAVP